MNFGREKKFNHTARAAAGSGCPRRASIIADVITTSASGAASAVLSAPATFWGRGRIAGSADFGGDLICCEAFT